MSSDSDLKITGPAANPGLLSVTRTGLSSKGRDKNLTTEQTGRREADFVCYLG